MAGVACKIIINNGMGALAQSLESALTSPLVRGEMVKAEICDALIQRMADIDLATYDPEAHEMPPGGLAGVMLELQGYGVITDEVWEVYRRPATKS